jgi:radical SAM protein with 4Fe4S-binding SPASM domain
MINITKLLFGTGSFGDELRYNEDIPVRGRRPVVVWNTTRRCNLACIHCYSDSSDKKYPGELSLDEAKRMIADLADFSVPVLLFSGGEPLLREDLFELIIFAKSLKLRTVISTNGTLITEVIAKKIKEIGVDYVGVSLDGIGKNNDRFRGKTNAFNLAISGIRNLVKVGQKTGLRFTITRHNYADLSAIFKLAESEKIDRACFYHLVYSGRGSSMIEDNITHQEMRRLIDSICEWATYLYKKGINKEVLTVDNHADGPYVYLKLKETNPQRAEVVLGLLKLNGGNNSGIGIAAIDNLGFVHPDQFWQDYSFGNVREQDFKNIWLNTNDALMQRLKDRKRYLKGRCSECRFLGICNGNFRVRARAVYNDFWQEDPACYLSEAETYGAKHS